MVVSQSYNPNNWVVDNGATHHLTSDLNDLLLHQPYTGGEDMTIADGSALAISHTGSSSLNTLSPLALNDILCVHNVHKNLISVYHLGNTNNVSFRFFPAHFQVKDLSTRTGYSKVGLKTNCTNGRFLHRIKSLSLPHHHQKHLFPFGILVLDTPLFLFCNMLFPNFLFLFKILHRIKYHVPIASLIKVTNFPFTQILLSQSILLTTFILMFGHRQFIPSITSSTTLYSWNTSRGISGSIRCG